MRLTIHAELALDEDDVYTADYLGQRVHADLDATLTGMTIALRGSDTAELSVSDVEIR